MIELEEREVGNNHKRLDQQRQWARRVRGGESAREQPQPTHIAPHQRTHKVNSNRDEQPAAEEE